MRVNVYAEEMTDKVEIISKEIDGRKYTGLRIYLELPVTSADGTQVKGPFVHRPDNDDSSAITFWGKRDLRKVLYRAIAALDNHYGPRLNLPETEAEEGRRTKGAEEVMKTAAGLLLEVSEPPEGVCGTPDCSGRAVQGSRFCPPCRSIRSGHGL